MKLEYSSTGKTMSFRCSINDLSSRDKVELFRQLMEDLGITDRFNAEPDATAAAQLMITEQWDKAWNG